MQTKTGAATAAYKLTTKDPDYFKKIGALGGKKTGIKKGFATMSAERLREVSAKGGSASKKNSTSVSSAEYTTLPPATLRFGKSRKVQTFLRTVAGRGGV